MARPRVADPKSARVVAACTVGEKESFQASARAAGLSESELARARLFGVERAQAEVNDVRGRQALNSRKVLAAVNPPSPALTEPASPTLPPRDAEGLTWCPEPLCQFRAVGKSKCPVHGRDTERM